MTKAHRTRNWLLAVVVLAAFLVSGRAQADPAADELNILYPRDCFNIYAVWYLPPSYKIPVNEPGYAYATCPVGGVPYGAYIHYGWTDAGNNYHFNTPYADDIPGHWRSGPYPNASCSLQVVVPYYNMITDQNEWKWSDSVPLRCFKRNVPFLIRDTQGQTGCDPEATTPCVEPTPYP